MNSRPMWLRGLSVSPVLFFTQLHFHSTKGEAADVSMYERKRGCSVGNNVIPESPASKCSSTLPMIAMVSGAEKFLAMAKRGNEIKVMKCPPSAVAMQQLISLDRSDGEQLSVSATS